MSTAGKTHLYTFWNPNLYADTIEDHIRTLARECVVKWVILYDDQTWLAEKGKPINLRALLNGNTIFMGSLGDKEVRRINDQAKEDETLLFMQCLNIFQKPLYVGKVKRMEIIRKTGIDLSDALIPDYYRDIIAERRLRPHYSITLTDIKEAALEDICNLIPEAKFQSKKFPFPYPVLVTQRKPKSLFERNIPYKIDELEIAYEREPVTNRTCWYVKRPKSVNCEKPLTLGKREMDLIKCFKGQKALVANVRAIAREINIKIQNVQNRVTSLNKKFAQHYGRGLIELGRGRYLLQTVKINILT